MKVILTLLVLGIGYALVQTWFESSKWNRSKRD